MFIIDFNLEKNENVNGTSIKGYQDFSGIGPENIQKLSL